MTNHAVVAMLGERRQADALQRRATPSTNTNTPRCRGSGARPRRPARAVFAGARECAQAGRARRARAARTGRTASHGSSRRRAADTIEDAIVEPSGGAGATFSTSGRRWRREAGRRRDAMPTDDERERQSRQRGREGPSASAADPRVAAAATKGSPADAADSRIHHPAARRSSEPLPAASPARTGGGGGQQFGGNRRERQLFRRSAARMRSGRRQATAGAEPPHGPGRSDRNNLDSGRNGRELTS